MSNPVLNDNMYHKAVLNSVSEKMTTNGAIMKSFILAFVFSITALFTYSYLTQRLDVPYIPFILIPTIVAFVLAIIMAFKPSSSPFLSVIYTILQAIAVSSISYIFNAEYSGIVFEAVICTMVSFFTMLFLFRTGIIKATERFKAVITTAVMAIAIFYLIMFVISFFGIRPYWFYGSSTISIAISIGIIIIASLSLILDFDFIVEGENQGLPKYMEWYAAFGLIVTIIWLYLEILRLLAKLKDR